MSTTHHVTSRREHLRQEVHLASVGTTDMSGSAFALHLGLSRSSKNSYHTRQVGDWLNTQERNDALSVNDGGSRVFYALG
jgi:hypothetical protein